MHIDLDRRLTFEEAHAIVVEAENRVQALFPGADVLIHADPRGPWGAPISATASPSP